MIFCFNLNWYTLGHIRGLAVISECYNYIGVSFLVQKIDFIKPELLHGLNPIADSLVNQRLNTIRQR